MSFFKLGSRRAVKSNENCKSVYFSNSSGFIN